MHKYQTINLYLLAIFTVHTIKWHVEGKSLLLLGKDQMCMCFLRPEQANNDPAECGDGA